MDNSYVHDFFPILLGNIPKSYQLWADLWIRSGWRVQTNVMTGSSRTLSPTGKIVAAGDEVECLLEARRVATRSDRHHAVILLHGMGRTRYSFRKLEAQLEEEGFAVANISYASLSDSSETHVRRLKNIVDGLVEDGARQISFVGHSLGGLLIRRLLDNSLPVPVSRIVFLGTPNCGSYLAKRLSRMTAYRHIFGPCGLEVFPDAVANLAMPEGEIAIISGGNGRAGYNRFLPNDNDGVVMVDETRMDGREAFLRVPCIHTFLPSSKMTNLATYKFLKTGKMDI
jgi:pimeloyl-ACP methyl ester carboxylesterase